MLNTAANQVYEDVLSNVVTWAVAYPTRTPSSKLFLAQGSLVLICHPQHPFAKQKSIRLKTLAGQKFIVSSRHSHAKALDKIMKEHGVDPNSPWNSTTLKR